MIKLNSPRVNLTSLAIIGPSEENCAQCIFVTSATGRCALHGYTIEYPGDCTCASWVNFDMSAEDGEETFRIKEGCPLCDYSNEINDVPDSRFEDSKRALEKLVGVHILHAHPEQVARMMEVFSGPIQAFCALTVDAARKIGSLADYGRKSGRVVGKLNEAAKNVGK